MESQRTGIQRISGKTLETTKLDYEHTTMHYGLTFIEQRKSTNIKSIIKN